jgi:hypothetical protein
MPQKERPGDIHPAKSSQDPHSAAPFRASNRSGILCELKQEYQHF